MHFESARHHGYNDKHIFIYDNILFDIYYIHETLRVWYREIYGCQWCNDSNEDHNQIVVATIGWYATGGAGMALWEYLNIVLGDL
jgi:hypothetical protein